ncbi:hypothetical protein H4R19_005493, partial [Coemansia spiralis]
WNQWVATLEAKLVARWQENGKADVIYGFGLFLSHECCEPAAQDAVRDIAWGEGGRNLLALLDNAIHLSGCVDPAKCSPSADSAVSDATCLPTPDPNAWVHIRSPASPQIAPRPATIVTTGLLPISTASATPTTAHYAGAVAVPAPRDDADAAHKRRELCARRSYADYRGPAAFSMRPSSMCSVPVAPPGAAGIYPGPYAAGRAAHRHVSESRSYDWSQQTAHSAASQQHVPHIGSGSGAGSGSTMVGYAHGPRACKAVASPFDQLSGGTTSIALSYSSDSRDSTTAPGGFGDTAAQVPVARGMHFGTVPRAPASSQAVAAGYVGGPLDRAAEPPTLTRIASVSGRMAGPIPISEFRPAGSATTAAAAAATTTARGRGFRPNVYSTIELSTTGGFALSGTQRRPSCDDAGASSGAASMAASLGRQGGPSSRHFGSSAGGGASGTMGIHARNRASKSPSPSIKGSSRRSSWRYSGRHSASNIAQKLRAFAAFGRSSAHSSTSSTSSGSGERDYSAKGSESYENTHGRYAEAGLSLGAAAAGVDTHSRRPTTAYISQTIAGANPASSNRHHHHPHRLGHASSAESAAASAHHRPPLELDATKYLFMK